VLTPDDEGHWKLHDDKINWLRSGAVSNDIKVRGWRDGVVLGESWHPSSCELEWNEWVPATSDCNLSTRSGASATDYTASGHRGALGRWYVDSSFGYLLPITHIGPMPGAESHGGSLPNPYCTFYDHRVCTYDAAIEVWAY
jgi:hypothetical protein